jgi:hypothetical protein
MLISNALPREQKEKVPIGVNCSCRGALQ